MNYELRVLIIILLAIAFVGCRSGKKSASGVGLPVFELSEATLGGGQTDTLRLGKMRDGEKVELGFLLRNNTVKPFVIEKVVSGCGCTEFTYTHESVAAGGSTEMKALFDSTGFMGEVMREAKIFTSASQEPLRLVIEAEIR